MHNGQHGKRFMLFRNRNSAKPKRIKIRTGILNGMVHGSLGGREVRRQLDSVTVSFLNHLKIYLF